ncbi:sugar ABC transporter substrate-binding protein [Sinorhizobium sp. 7-81]|uniref:ABC transporter substrate-binding protein n=1 Tax=Sinorhizobium sp. 8-89 TaxID=3049089 RepID=UPI0024C2D388|nr:sugar ABC transporter substrate-binding protein [Sinorhizobium sp. 8-89]MDK1493733.1 sugar ABC transporter substrate-binding protein [Sinorhizobium sp. 8-89]
MRKSATNFVPPVVQSTTTTTHSGLTRRQVLKSAVAAGVVAYTGSGAIAADGITEVTFPWFGWQAPPDSLFWQPFKQEFEQENPDIRIDDIPVPYGAFWDKQFLELSSANSSDIVTMFDSEIKSYINYDFLEPLNPYLEKAGVTLDDFQPGSRAAVKDGKIFGLPIIVNPRAMLYFSDMLDNVGLHPPTNVTEFYAALQKLRNKEKQQWGFATWAKPGAPSSLYLEIAPIIFGFGGAFFEAGEPTATKPETIEALEFYRRIYDEDLIPKGVNFETYRELFAQGRIAMYSAGSYMGPLVRTASMERMSHLRSMALPFPGRRTFALSVFMGIGKTAKHKDAAARVLLGIVSKHMQSKLLETTAQLPGRQDIDASGYIAANPWIEAFAAAAGDPHTVSFAPDGAEVYAPEVIKIIGKNVEAMIFGNSTAKDAAQTMQKELESLKAVRMPK